jgi:hypothetical protein
MHQQVHQEIAEMVFLVVIQDKIRTEIHEIAKTKVDNKKTKLKHKDRI